jgi:hypothetical protein
MGEPGLATIDSIFVGDSARWEGMSGSKSPGGRGPHVAHFRYFLTHVRLGGWGP